MTMVDRVTSIIDVFDDATVGLSLDQIADRADLPRSTTHRILDHLVRLKWLCHGERGYGLGDRAMSWGAGDAANLRLREAAATTLHRLHIQTAAVVHLGVLDDRDVVHVDKLGGPTADTVPTRVGSRLPARDVALGLVILARRPPEDLDTEDGIDLDLVRRTGGLVRTDDYRTGLTSVAAAVDARAAMGIVLPRNISGDRYLPLVLEAAGQVRRALG
jgi:DNA-binding IclR family transcriptional regulator